MKKTALNTALSTAFILALGVSLSACGSEKEGESHGGDSHEVLAKERVDEAAELARENAPEPIDMDFPDTPPMAAANTEGMDAEGTASADAAMDNGASETTSDANMGTDAAADSADTPATTTTKTDDELGTN